MFKKITTEVQPGLETRVIWLLAVFIDAVFLTIWAIGQYGLDLAIASLELTGTTFWVFFSLQIFSAISTLIPVAFFIYEDTSIMWIRTRGAIQREKQIEEHPNTSQAIEDKQ